MKEVLDAWIAIRKDHYVVAAILAAESDLLDWITEMNSIGFETRNVGKKYAKEVIFSYLSPTVFLA